MKRVCIYCGSNPGSHYAYVEMAHQLGLVIARRNIELVYGGANVGTMGVLANTVLDAGGKVIGVITSDLIECGVAHDGLTELHIVNTMHERKAAMLELSDGFIALPGGLGTLEEFFEVFTWSQLGLHEKPCGLLNVNGYYDKLMEFLDHAVNQAFIREEHKAMILISNDPDTLLEEFKSFKVPSITKWIR